MPEIDGIRCLKKVRSLSPEQEGQVPIDRPNGLPLAEVDRHVPFTAGFEKKPHHQGDLSLISIWWFTIADFAEQTIHRPKNELPTTERPTSCIPIAC